MSHSPRVILTILDGLRPDAVVPTVMPHLFALGSRGWQVTARTVTPSVTVAALGSLATGVSPQAHGLREGALPPLHRVGRLRPVPGILRRHGKRSLIVTGQLPASAAITARTLLGLGGITRFVARGRSPVEVGRALRTLTSEWTADLAVVYLNECDVAGHRSGWMSGPYLDAARSIDHVMPVLLDAANAGGALLLVTADHGGGGIDCRDHDAPHPLNQAIPVIAAGPALTTRPIPDQSVRLLDLPPTILATLGVPVPPEYEGRVLPLVERIAAAA